MTKYDELKLALLEAMDEAEKYIDTEDGGTCNFDAPALSYKGMKKATVIEILESLGLRCFDWNLYKQGNRLVICGFQSGIADRRSLMSEQFAKIMQDKGYDCAMYYQMD